MRVLVCGGRDFGHIPLDGPTRPAKIAEYESGMSALDRLSLDWPKTPEDQYGNWLPEVTIIQGGATGADNLAVDWAIVNWCVYETYEAEWDKYGKRAGPIRNKKMLDEGKPDLVVAFPGGKGTANMVKLAEEAGVKVIRIESVQS